jgi:splicing factor 3B subunit 3
MNRDANNKLIISSPLEAHKPHTLTLDICALDNGLENPQFAALEINYGDEDDNSSAVVTGDHEKTLVIYEVDLGLNHVIRKFAESVPKTAHHLIPVPGGAGDEGPGGLIVACEGELIYKKQDHEERCCPIPKRLDYGDRNGVHIINSSGFYHDGHGVIIFLQSDCGDLYKLTLDQVGEDVLGLNLFYFDTIAPCIKINLLESGFLFAAGDCSNHHIFRLTSLGEDKSPPIFCPRSINENLEICD